MTAPPMTTTEKKMWIASDLYHHEEAMFVNASGEFAGLLQEKMDLFAEEYWDLEGNPPGGDRRHPPPPNGGPPPPY